MQTIRSHIATGRSRQHVQHQGKGHPFTNQFHIEASMARAQKMDGQGTHHLSAPGGNRPRSQNFLAMCVFAIISDSDRLSNGARLKWPSGAATVTVYRWSALNQVLSGAAIYIRP